MEVKNLAKKGWAGKWWDYGKVKSKAGQSQTATVMKEFHKGKLRSKAGEIVTDVAQAKAIAMSEGRAVQKRGKKKSYGDGSRKTK